MVASSSRLRGDGLAAGQPVAGERHRVIALVTRVACSVQPPVCRADPGCGSVWGRMSHEREQPSLVQPAFQARNFVTPQMELEFRPINEVPGSLGAKPVTDWNLQPMGRQSKALEGFRGPRPFFRPELHFRAGRFDPACLQVDGIGAAYVHAKRPPSCGPAGCRLFVH